MKKQILGAAGILTAGLIAGSAFSITAAANAADETNSSVASTNSVATDTTSTDTTQAGTPAGMPDVFSTESIKPGESLVTGDALTKLIDLAQAKYPGSTIIRVENDSDGGKYEVHLKQATGSVVTITFDENFAVTGTHNGFGDPQDHDNNGLGKGLGMGKGHDQDGDDQGDDNDNDGDGPAAGTFQLQAPTTQSN